MTAARTPIYLVRHAPTAWSGERYCGRSDPWLSADGRAAAGRVGEHIADAVREELAVLDDPPVIISSPRRRCRQTARAIMGALRVRAEGKPRGRGAPGAPGGVPGAPRLVIDAGWAEVDFGRYEGRTWLQLEAADPVLAARLLAADPAIDWPAGETASTFHARVMRAWHAAGTRRGTVVIVTHSGPIRTVLGTAGSTDAAVWPDVGSIHRVLRSET